MRQYYEELLGHDLWEVLYFLAMAEKMQSTVTLNPAQVSILLDHIDGKHIPPTS